MSKTLELIRTLIDGANEYEKKTGNTNPTVYLSKNNLLIIEKALQRLESIDNAEPSEALECLEKLKGMEISSMPFSDEYGTQEVDLNDIRKVGSQLNTDFREYTATIKQALLKAQEPKKYLDELKLVEKKLKAFEILKKLFRNPDGYSMLALVNCEYPDTSFRIESTDDSWIHTEISKEEFDILKEVLE